MVVSLCLLHRSPNTISKDLWPSVDNHVHLYLILEALLPTPRSILVGSYGRHGLPWMYSDPHPQLPLQSMFLEMYNNGYLSYIYFCIRMLLDFGAEPMRWLPIVIIRI